MDSFCDEPRSAPVPTSTQASVTGPSVPEVSMIFQSDYHDVSNQRPLTNQNPLIREYPSYNAWKTRNQNTNNGNDSLQNFNKENMPYEYGQVTHNMNLPNASKKQVRFESPVLQQFMNYKNKPLTSHKQVESNDYSVSALAPHRLESSATQPLRHINIDQYEHNPVPMSVKSFEQIYMANVPNRHLDLSMIDQQSVTTKYSENIKPPEINRHKKLSPVKEMPINEILSKSNPLEFKNLSNVYESSNDKRQNLLHDRTSSKEISFVPNKKLPYRTQPSAVGQQNIENNINSINYMRVNEPASYNYNCNRNSQNSRNSRNFTETVARNEPFYLTKFEETRPQIELGTNVRNAPVPFELSDTSDVLNGNTKIPCKKNYESDAIQPYGHAEETPLKDLLKIIQQQNEQILILQKQVATLLENKASYKQIEAPPVRERQNNQFHENFLTDNGCNSKQLNSTLQNNSPKKGPLPQFSIDVMTSFEVSIRPPQSRNRFFREPVHCEPKIQEITETESNAIEALQCESSSNAVNTWTQKPNPGAKNQDVSLSLADPVHVQEDSQSPENSIHVDMQDFSSDSEDDTDSSDIGWTFYNNLMGQVNKMLKKSTQSKIDPTKKSSDTLDGNNPMTFSVKEKTMKQVKEATMNHLKTIGVNVPNIDEISDYSSSNEREYSPTEVSFAVKQLLMKYLPNEQLAKVIYKQRRNAPTETYATPQTDLIKRRPEFSFATVQYMKKYNLLASELPRKKEMKRQLNGLHVFQQNADTQKVLDITALKQQPKLM